MKVYEANLLIAVVAISLFLESTGQNIGMLKSDTVVASLQNSGLKGLNDWKDFVWSQLVKSMTTDDTRL